MSEQPSVDGSFRIATTKGSDDVRESRTDQPRIDQRRQKQAIVATLVENTSAAQWKLSMRTPDDPEFVPVSLTKKASAGLRS